MSEELLLPPFESVDISESVDKFEVASELLDSIDNRTDEILRITRSRKIEIQVDKLWDEVEELYQCVKDLYEENAELRSKSV